MRLDVSELTSGIEAGCSDPPQPADTMSIATAVIRTANMRLRLVNLGLLIFVCVLRLVRIAHPSRTVPTTKADLYEILTHSPS